MKGSGIQPIVGVVILGADDALTSLEALSSANFGTRIEWVKYSGHLEILGDVSNRVKQLLPLSDLAFDRTDAIAVVGDFALLDEQSVGAFLIDVLQRFDADRKPIGGLSTGVAALGEAGVVVGKSVSAVNDALTVRMKRYGALPVSTPTVVVGWLVTAGSLSDERQFWRLFAEVVLDRPLVDRSG